MLKKTSDKFNPIIRPSFTIKYNNFQQIFVNFPSVLSYIFQYLVYDVGVVHYASE